MEEKGIKKREKSMEKYLTGEGEGNTIAKQASKQAMLLCWLFSRHENISVLVCA